MRRNLSVLIMALVWGFVNAPTAWSTENSAKKQRTQISPAEARQGLIQLLLDDGYEDSFESLWSKHFGFPDPTPAYTTDYASGTASDGLGHSCSLVVEKSENGAIKPLNLIFTAVKTSGAVGADVERHTFIVGLDGKLEKASITHGKAKVQGSAIYDALDIDSPNVKKRLQHELDFWFYGKYHKDPKPWLKDLETYRLKALAAKKS